LKPITESDSHYTDLEKMMVIDLLHHINREDKTVAYAVEKVIPEIDRLTSALVSKMKSGGRLFYIGAGTSGRLGILDASECPPTFGVPQGLVIGLIAGGDNAIRKAVEFAEDDRHQGWKDLQQHNITSTDFVIGIAASGTTPYVIGALELCRKNGIATGCITCNPGTPVSAHADHSIEVIVGPELVTGSTRMKAGTAQKLVLNMISTAVMIRLGRVQGNKMVDMQLTNNKLVNRGTQMVAEQLGVPDIEAAQLLEQAGSVRKAVDDYHIKKNS